MSKRKPINPCSTKRTVKAQKSCRARVSKKIKTLVKKEGVPQRQAVAMALNMERVGRLGPRGGYRRVRRGTRATCGCRSPASDAIPQLGTGGTWSAAIVRGKSGSPSFTEWRLGDAMVREIPSPPRSGVYVYDVYRRGRELGVGLTRWADVAALLVK